MDFGEQDAGNDASMFHRGFDLEATLEGQAIMLARSWRRLNGQEQVHRSSVRGIEIQSRGLNFNTPRPKIQDSRTKFAQDLES